MKNASIAPFLLADFFFAQMLGGVNVFIYISILLSLAYLKEKSAVIFLKSTLLGVFHTFNFFHRQDNE